MIRTAVFVFFLSASLATAAEPVLVIADEIPAMEVFARQLKSRAGLESKIVTQKEMPPDLSAFPAVVVYIHRQIDAPAELAFIAYAKAGGRLVLLHHTISSGKRKNREWFPFLGVSLPETPFEQGGYRWIEGVVLDIVNLAPSEAITTRGVVYPAKAPYAAPGSMEELRSAFHLEDSEVYLNHVYTGERKTLLGLRFTDSATGKVFMQPSAGWEMRAGRGTVFYFMPGHSAREFDNPAYAQILANAISGR